MNNRLSNSVLFLTALLTGFYAGIGFSGMMGGNPALAKMSSPTFAEYWQLIDFFMAARMKFFGPLLLLTLITAIIIHIRAWRTPILWLLVGAFLILMVDLAVGITRNQPLNQLIQSWSLSNLPDDVQQIKLKVIDAFWIRNYCMIGCFVCVLLAVFWRRKQSSL